MPTAKDALLQYEAGQTLVDYIALTDQGDHQDFRSAAALWSRKSGKEPTVRPNGVANGLQVIPAVAAGNDNVDVKAGYCYLAGVYTQISASQDESCTRATPTDTHIINSIQITGAGAISVVAGTDGTSFSETRGGTGGPPYVLVDSIEIAQVRFDSNSSAAVEADEVFDVPGTHRELWNYPTFTIDYFKVEDGTLGYAGVDFTSALPTSHTGDVCKKVYATYNTPTFANIPDAYDFVEPAITHSVNSQQVYGRVVGSAAQSLAQGSFSVLLTDGVTDAFLSEVNENIFFKYFQDRLKTPYVLSQGTLGLVGSNPADNNIGASCTISAESAAERVSS